MPETQFYIGFGTGIFTGTLLAHYLLSRGPPTDKEILRRGEKTFSRLKEQGLLEDKLAEDYIAIEPRSGKYVFGNSHEEVIKGGIQEFGHPRFYVRPVDGKRIPVLSRL